LSCLSHLGAILGIASFSWGLRAGMPVSFIGSPSRSERRSSASTYSWRQVVFSINFI
jgi:hypothetical protein